MHGHAHSLSEPSHIDTTNNAASATTSAVKILAVIVTMVIVITNENLWRMLNYEKE